jgi:hypothetical protein
MERRVIASLKSAGVQVHTQSAWGNTLVLPSDLPFRGGATSLPDVFTQFRLKVLSCVQPDLRFFIHS